MKYDFILFENLYSVENHYKDLDILVRLLMKAGYNVAIADAFKESKLCQPNGVPHIEIDISCPRLFRDPQTYSSKSSSWKDLYYRIRKDYYMYRVLKKVNGMAPNIYLGSMTLATPAFFFHAFQSDTNYYMWALRSSHLLNWKCSSFGLFKFVSKALYNNCVRRKNLRLIVSNELILQEFIQQVGIPRERLIIRPERIIEYKRLLRGKGAKGVSLNILFIGTLRAFKNVEFCIEALKRLSDLRITYTIAGRCKSNTTYNDKISRLIENMPNVIRIDRYIPDDEYEQLMSDCDFLVLCDKKQASCASNGTMIEALLHGKPIIAPDFNPFKYEIYNHGIGYMYHYEDVDSLCRVLKKALESGADVFYKNISTAQECYLENAVIESLRNQIKIIYESKQ